MNEIRSERTLEVDAALCSGHGRCYSLSPELLQPDDEGFVAIRGRSIPVPPGLEDAATTAAEACPEQAIRVY